MTENLPPRATRSAPVAKRAPGWIAPVIAGVLCAGITWGVGSTVFRGILEERGLPEQIRDASAEEKTLWEHGAKLNALAIRADNLAGLADKKSALALTDLASTLHQSAGLLGQLSFADEQTAPPADQVNVDSIALLATDVSTLSARLPASEQPSASTSATLARISFQSNLDTREALRSSADQKQLTEVALPLSGQPADEAAPVTCLNDPQLLDPTASINDPATVPQVSVARALDRGYALDYVLQLQAARSAQGAADNIEQRRLTLNDQLRALRSVRAGDCADLRQPAYDLPEKALTQLDKLSATAETDFALALVDASGAVTGSAQQVLANTAWQVMTGESAQNGSNQGAKAESAQNGTVLAINLLDPKS